MSFCIPPAQAQKFIGALRDGKIDPQKLAAMSSKERNDFLAGVIGKENAKATNALFESKLLLKNQKKGMVTWAKQVAGLKEPARRDLVARINRLDRVLDPKEEDQFLSDLASTKLGVDVTEAEAKAISQAAAKVQKLEPNRTSIEKSLEKGWEPTAKDLEYGRAVYDANKLVSDLKVDADKLKIRDLRGRQVARAPAIALKNTADVTKSIGASLDNSFALRQGIKTFYVSNKLWRKEFQESFKNLARGFKNSEQADREFHARLMADPSYNDAIRNGLALKGNEDVFPTSLPEKIPVAGRFFGASEVAYNAFAQNLRLGLYKEQMKIAKELGDDVPKDYAKNMAKMVNSLTGRGGLGKGEPYANEANIAFYSLRFLKSNIDTLFSHPLGLGVGGTGDFALGKAGAQIASPAQKKAATSLAKIVAGTAAILATANALKPGSVEFDPRSSDFGKIRVGNTRFDVTGGMGSLGVLAVQQALGESKSSKTGAITKMNSGEYGGSTRLDSLVRFLENKLSPIGSEFRDRVLRGETHSGNKPGLGSTAQNLGVPLGIKNVIETKKDENSANVAAVWLGDALGISSSTYGRSQKDWATDPNPGKEVEAFKKSVSPEEFKKANKEFNDKITKFNAVTIAKADFKDLPSEEKSKLLTSGQTKIKKQVFDKYGFSYKRQKTPNNVTNTKKSLLESAK